MIERQEERIRAFIVELVDDPPQAPPFPGSQEAKPVAPRSQLAWRGPLVGLAVLALTLVVGFLSLVLTPGETDQARPPPTAERAVELLVEGINAGNLSAAMEAFAPEARCRIGDSTGPVDQDCEGLFGFLIASNTVIVLENCLPVGNGVLSDGQQVESHSCLMSFRTDIHTALETSRDETADVNPSVHFSDGLIQEIWIVLPFTGNLALDNQLWSYLLSVEADYINEDGIPIFAPSMADDFKSDAADFISQNPQP